MSGYVACVIRDNIQHGFRTKMILIAGLEFIGNGAGEGNLMLNRNRCEIHNCHTIPFVAYAVSEQITKTLCRRHMHELEQRGRRPRDLVAMEKRAKEEVCVPS